MNSLFRFCGVTAVLVSTYVVVSFSSHQAFAQNAYYDGTTIFVYTTAKDFTREAAINSYVPIGGYNANRVVYHDVSGMNADQVRALVNQNVANNPSASYVTYTVGHGGPGAVLTGPMNRNDWGKAINNGYYSAGVTGTWGDDSCKSGNCGSLFDANSASAIDGIFTSTRPGVDGNDTNYGRGWQSDYGDAIRRMLSNSGKGGPNDPDVNKDGVLTVKEVGDYLNKTNPGTYKPQVGKEDKPMFFKDKETAAKFGKKIECIVLRPGQVDESYIGKATSTEDVLIEFKPPSISGYGLRTKDSSAFPIFGTVQDHTTTNESQLNFDLRKTGSLFVERFVEASIADAGAAKGIKKKIVLLPTKSQAEQFVENGSKKISVNGIELDAGKHFLAYNPSPEDGVVFDDSCTAKEWTPPSPTPQPSFSADNNGGQHAPTQASGMDGLLAAMLQSLFGKPQNQEGTQNGQNQNIGNQTGNQQDQCPKYGVHPVCGFNDTTKVQTTFNNLCWLLEYDNRQINTGVCPSVSPSPTPAPDISGLALRLISSGAPQSVINAIINSLSTIFGHVSGQTVVQ